MKIVEQYESCGTNTDYSMTRMNYINLMSGVLAHQGVMVTLRQATLAGSVWTILGWGVYGVPLLLALIWTSFFISNAILQVVYRVYGPTRSVRWHANSLLRVFWTLSMCVLIPGLLLLVLVLVLVLPFGMVYIMNDNSGSYALDMQKANLFFIVYEHALTNSHSLFEFLNKVFFWDGAHPIISLVKFIMMPIVSLYLYYKAHDDCSMQEFYDSEQNVWLIYEKRSNN